MIFNLSDFLAACENSVSSALNFACKALNDGDTLALGGGRIDIYPDGAFRKYYCISNNDKGEKPIAFPLIGKKNITVDGGGAQLIFHGEIMPFAVDACENVTVKNLSVDYACPMYAQALIVESDEKHTVLQFDGKDFFCKVKNGNLCFYSENDSWEKTVESSLCIEFDPQKRAPMPYAPTYFLYTGKEKEHGFLSCMFRDHSAKQLDENLIEICDCPGVVHTAGNYLVMTYIGRDYPGVFVNESKNIRISNLRLYNTVSMGIICQLSENISLEKVTADVREGSGRVLSTDADATHFVNCRGKISITDCKFVSMMDDACNIHGIYLKAPEKQKNSENSFIAFFGHYQQVGINIFRPGDTAKLINTENITDTVALTVEKSVLLSENALLVIAKEPVPAAFCGKNYVVENASTQPEIYISDTESGNNRPRGFLLSSAGKTVVENCVFHNMYCGISIGGEMLDWYESGAVTDVEIINNDFNNSAYAGEYAIQILPRIKNCKTAGGFHGKIRIENNRFTMHEKRLLQAKNINELVFKNNTFVRDASLPSHMEDFIGETHIEYCVKTDIKAAEEKI